MTSCRLCGRRLRTPDSIRAGIGPVCRARESVASSTPQFTHAADSESALGVHRSREYFTRDEANALMGREFAATAAYADVPAGTIGRVTGTYVADRKRGLFGVEVTWRGIEGRSPLDLERGGLTDGFSRGDLEVVFTGGPNVGKRAMVPVEDLVGLKEESS